MQPQLKTRRKASGAMDAVEFLQDDQQQTRQFFRTIARMTAPDQRQDRLDLIRQVCHELMVHMSIEEMIFYPALRANLHDDAPVREALDAHDSMRGVLHDLQHPERTDDVDAKLSLLAQQVDQHVEEKENRLFPAALQLSLDLAAMGRMLAAASQQLRADDGRPAGSSITTPAEPRPALRAL